MVRAAVPGNHRKICTFSPVVVTSAVRVVFRPAVSPLERFYGPCAPAGLRPGLVRISLVVCNHVLKMPHSSPALCLLFLRKVAHGEFDISFLSLPLGPLPLPCSGMGPAKKTRPPPCRFTTPGLDTGCFLRLPPFPDTESFRPPPAERSLFYENLFLFT